MSERPPGLFTTSQGQMQATARELAAFRHDPARFTAFVRACQELEAGGQPAIIAARRLAALRDSLVDFLVAVGVTPRFAQAEARDLILERLLRLSRHGYYQYLRLADRLTPAAQELALQTNLTESYLRAVVLHIQDPGQQAACVQAIVTHGLSRQECTRLVQAVLSGGTPGTEAARLAASRIPRRHQDPGVSRRAWPLWALLRHTAHGLAWVRDPAAIGRRLRRLSTVDREHIRQEAQAAQAAIAALILALDACEPG